MWPPAEELSTAWRQLLGHPLTGGAALASVVLPPLEADLARQFPLVDAHLRTEAADWAVAAFLRNPNAFDPSRGSLPNYLRLAARRDLSNLIRGEERHHRRRIPWESVEVSAVDGKECEEALTPDEWAAVQTILADFSETDRLVIELMLDGERQTTLFAEVLGVTDRPPHEQREDVKRAKDRVKARLRRAGGAR